MKRKAPEFAKAYERFLAALIDFVIIGVPESLLLMAAPAGSAMAVFGQYAIYIVYFGFFESSSWQATPGKRVMKIYVSNANGTALMRRDAIARFIAFSMVTFPSQLSMFEREPAAMLTLWLMLVWFIPMLVTAEKTAMHDILCRTRVWKGTKGQKLEFK